MERSDSLRECILNFNSFKKILLTIVLVSLAQIPAGAIDDVWGSSMGITEDAIKQSASSNTVFDTPSAPAIRDEAPILTPPDLTSSQSVDKENKTIKDIEFYGLNSLPKDELLSQMKMKIRIPVQICRMI